MQHLRPLTLKLRRLSRVNLALFVFFAAIPAILAFVVPQPFMGNLRVRGLFFIGTSCLSAFFLKAWWESRDKGRYHSWLLGLTCAGLFGASLYLALSYIPNVSAIPFTLGWSEASRYYYASLFFSERIYGVHVPPTVLHPSRYLMQAAPFLIPNSPIWLHRLWQVLLWVSVTLAAAWVIARRMKISDRLIRWLVIGFLFNYLLIGPVYYHLLVPVILVVWGFHLTGRKKDTLISVFVVLLASIWCGISRVNWFPVPGCLAATFILLEQPVSLPGSERLEKRWKPVLLYILRLAGWVVIGTAVAFGAQQGYIRWSGNSAELFATSFTSDLLWHRLFPNLTYPPGILPGIAIVSLPFAVIILSRLFVHREGHYAWQRYHPIRLMGLFGILAVFFVGGVIVSVKIGGGSNLHNLDAFMVFLVLMGLYFYFEKTKMDLPLAAEENISDGKERGGLSGLLSSPRTANIAVAAAIIVSIGATLVTHNLTAPLPNPATVDENLRLLSKAVKQVTQEGGNVLFISNRQLLTFHYIDAALIPDYERVFLMETAMANDPAYMRRFHEDLRQQKFDLIISEPLSRTFQKAKDDFGAENNAWVKQVSTYILCYYKATKTLRDVQVQILTPSPEPKQHCP